MQFICFLSLLSAEKSKIVLGTNIKLFTSCLSFLALKKLTFMHDFILCKEGLIQASLTLISLKIVLYFDLEGNLWSL